MFCSVVSTKKWKLEWPVMGGHSKLAFKVPFSRIDWLPTGKVQPTGGKHTENARCWHQLWLTSRLQRSTTYCWSPRPSLLWGPTATHCRAHRWAKTGFVRLPCLTAWLMGSTESVTRFQARIVLATVFHWQHCTHAGAKTGEHCRHCFPTAGCHIIYTGRVQLLLVQILNSTVSFGSRTQGTELYAIGQGTKHCTSAIWSLKQNWQNRSTSMFTLTALLGKSMATRFGTSKKTKQVELSFLLVGKGLIKLRKIGTKDNCVDVLTKYLGTELLRSHLKKLCVSTPTERFELWSNFQSFTF